MVAMLRLVADPGAGAAAMRVLTGPRWRLGGRDISALWRRAVELDDVGGPRDRSSADEIVAAGRTRRRHRLPGRRDQRSGAGGRLLAGGSPADHRARPRVDRPACASRSSAARAGGRGASGARRRRRGPCGAAAVGRLERYRTPRRLRRRGGRLRRRAAAVRRCPICWPTWMPRRWWRTGWRPPRSEGGVTVAHDRVQILTVHAAKGLEWQVVAVPHLSGRVFPSTASMRTWLTDAADLPPLLRGDRATLGAHGVPVLDTSDVNDRKLLSDKISEHKRGSISVASTRSAGCCTWRSPARRTHCCCPVTTGAHPRASRGGRRSSSASSRRSSTARPPAG